MNTNLCDHIYCKGVRDLELIFCSEEVHILLLKNSRWQICSIFIIFYKGYLPCDTCHTCSKWPGNLSVSLISMHINLSKYMHMYTYPWYFIHTRSTGTANVFNRQDMKFYFIFIEQLWNESSSYIVICSFQIKLLNWFWLLSSFLSHL